MYNILAYTIIPFVILRLIWRGITRPEYLQHIGERLGRYKSESEISSPLWIHAVSVGEAYAAEPLIRQMSKDNPNQAFLVTTSTPTGRKIANELFAKKGSVVYLPIDVGFAVEGFLRKFKPSLGIIMETEIWPNLIQICKEKNIPIHLVNARLSKKSARKYARFAPIFKEAVRSLESIAAQTKQDAARFRFFGQGVIHVTGNIKFDRAIDEKHRAFGRTLKAKCRGNRTVFLAASTRLGEEQLLLKTILKIRTVSKNLTVIVPRHPERCKAIAHTLAQNNIKYQYFSRSECIDADTEVALGDELGKLLGYYLACDVALIGGSLLPYGGQNFFEACAVGAPVVLGPFTFNFDNFAKKATSQGAVIRLSDINQLPEIIVRLMDNELERKKLGIAGFKYFSKMQGATLATIETLNIRGL